MLIWIVGELHPIKLEIYFVDLVLTNENTMVLTADFAAGTGALGISHKCRDVSLQG
jgi:hypothetical protein